MAYEDVRHEPATDLIQRVVDDFRDLFREEVALARAEVREEASAWAAAGARLAAGGAVLGVGALFVLVAIALGVAALFHWPNWAGFLLVGVLLAIGGAVALQMGRARARRIATLPKTTHEVKETSQWIKDRMTSSAR